MDKPSGFNRISIFIVIPAYNVERKIVTVLQSIPKFVNSVVVVNDGSTDGTAEVIDKRSSLDERIIKITHSKNQGVGSAMKSGFSEALRQKADIIVKMDGDGQMSARDIPKLIKPLIAGEADYSKGNRFQDFSTLRRMPTIRLIGNTALSFLTKAATGYWDCIDPTNGFLAVRGDVLKKIPLDKVHDSYFFEISLLSRLYLIDAYIHNVPLPARYADEDSNMSIFQILGEFPRRLALVWFRRIFIKSFLINFSMEAIYLALGIPMALFGGIYGLVNWIWYSKIGIGAPTGTIMIAAVMLILGFQFCLAAIHIDLGNVPKKPINSGKI